MRRALAVLFLLAAPAGAQDFFTLKGHGGPIMDIDVSKTGQIATASFDNAVGLWTGDTPKWLDGHEAAVNTVLFGKDDLVYSASDDFSVRIWNTQTGKVTRLEGHSGKVMDLAEAPDGGTILSASWDGTIGLWHDNDQVFAKGHKGAVNDVEFAPDGQTFFSASADGTIREWDRWSGTEKRILVSHGFGVNRLVVNPVANWLAYGAVDGATRILDLETGEQIADFTLDRRPILALAFDPNGQQLAVGDGEGYIMVIDAAAWKIARDFRATQRGPIWALAFSPDGQNIHAGGIEDILYSWPVATMDAHGQMTNTARSFLEDPKTLGNGERQFKRKCSICHTLTEGSARKAGPSLYQVFGRKAGTVTDYSYSDTLTGSEIIWSAETINALFDEGPDHYIPGTKMPMQRIAKQQDRDDLIAYLRDASN